MLKYIKPTLIPFYLISIFSIFWLLFIYKGNFINLWITPNQIGYRYYIAEDYINASKSFEDISFRGASLYRAGEFKKAKSIYMLLTDRDSRYNLGNSYLMMGKYEKAIKAYDIALQIDPNFIEAKENRELAKARAELLNVDNDGEQGVGELGADEIIYDNKASKGVEDTVEGKKEGSNQQNWLDRIETSPKEFLKRKFGYQYNMRDKNE
jgi:Ca-activated chloride channel family protein